MEDKPSLKLLFFSLIPKADKISSYKLSFFDKIHVINSSEEIYYILEEIFKYRKDKTIVFIELYDKNNKQLNKIEFLVLYEKNTKYLEIDGNGHGHNFEMIFRNCENLKVNFLDKEFNLFENNNTKDGKQLTILNYNIWSLNFNSAKINSNKENQNIPCPENPFYQLSIIILQDNKIIIGTNEIISQYEKEINCEKLFLKKNNLKEREPHLLNKKVKRSVTKNDDDHSSLEIKNKKRKMKIWILNVLMILILKEMIKMKAKRMI